MEYIVAAAVIVTALACVTLAVSLAVLAKRGDQVIVTSGHAHPRGEEWPDWNWPQRSLEFEEREVLAIAEVADEYGIPLDLLIGRSVERFTQ